MQMLCGMTAASTQQLEPALDGIKPSTAWLYSSNASLQWMPLETGYNLRNKTGKVEIVPSVEQQTLGFSV